MDTVTQELQIRHSGAFNLMAYSMSLVVLFLVVFASVIQCKVIEKKAFIQWEVIEKKGFKTAPPYIVAHRGAWGEYPESTTASFHRAIEDGADFIETDITATKDGVLICFHDILLDAITDVASHTEFLDRIATYYDPETRQNVTGYFTVDFTLKEIKTLRLKQRLDFRDQSFNGLFDIITFEEYLSIAKNSKRTIGIDPEIKSPTFINSHVKWAVNKRFEDVFVETLLKYGYNAPYNSKAWLKKPIFIQTFAPTSIIYIASKIQSPKILAIAPPGFITQDTQQPYYDIFTDKYLDFLGKNITGLSTKKDIIAPVDSNRKLLPRSDFVDRAHARGLLVQIAGLSNEAQYMARDFGANPFREFEFYVGRIGSDIVQTDFPATLADYMKAKGAGIVFG